LSEAESRGALLLAAHGITAELVRLRWPKLRPMEGPPPGSKDQFSADVELSLVAAAERMSAFLRPLVLATEHVLLGLVAAGHDASTWLVEQGLSTEAVESEINRVYECPSGPLAMEESAEPGDRDSGFGVSANRVHGLGLEDRASDNVEAIANCKMSNDEPASAVPSSLISQPAAVHGPRTTDHRLRPNPQLPFRVLDAAANRAREGLRVVEDYVRFVLDDRHLTSELKELRHALTACLSRVSSTELLAARDTLADVGCELTTAAERERSDLAGVVTANFKRLEESLRSLEEYGKVVDASLASDLKRIRYRSYTLERAVELTRAGGERLAGVRLYVLTDGSSSMAEFDRRAGALVASGVGAIQLRDKRLADGELLARARRLRELTRDSATLFIMNDRPDLAVLAGADGVHVGQDELTIHDVRAIVAPKMLIGVSTHSLPQAKAAVLAGASYIGVGPIFASDTKHFDAAKLAGLDLLRAVAAEIRLPAFAIGGINLGKLADVLATGFTRIAVSGAIAAARDPAAAASELMAALRGNVRCVTN
jgi:thiamine-phosphate pyrophosphorylase